MHQVLTMQTSRRACGDGSSFVSKRMCCSVLMSIGFIAFIGGFLLGRFTTNREQEIKAARLQTERQAYEARNGAYSETLSTFSEALSNLTKTTNRRLLNNSNESDTNRRASSTKEDILKHLRSILNCNEVIGASVNAEQINVEKIASDRLRTLTECAKEATEYVLKNT